MGKEMNVYERAQAYRRRTKVVKRGEIWIATGTMLIIQIKHGYMVFQLKGHEHD